METLKNGTRFSHRQTDRGPVAAVTVLIEGGAREDGAPQSGRTNMVARLIGKGSQRRSSDDMAEAFERLGIRFGASAGQDSVSVSFACLDSDFGRAMDLAGEALLEPLFGWDEIETERAKVLAELRAREDQNSSVAMRRLRREIFQPHPYARTAEGEAETVRALGQSDLVLRHREILEPGRVVVSIVGAVAADAARARAEALDARLPQRGMPPIRSNAQLPPRSQRVLVPRPAEQGFIAMGHLACPVASEDTAAVMVATNVLGGGMSSRLFSELRDRKGLAYAVGAGCALQQLHGMFYTYIGTKPERLREAEDGLWAEIVRMREEVVAPGELERAKNYMLGNFLRSLETNYALSASIASNIFLGLGEDHETRWPERVRAVTTRDIMRVANRYFTDPVTVIVEPEARPS
jgi:predicted Zn-dependent peptidase